VKVHGLIWACAAILSSFVQSAAFAAEEAIFTVTAQRGQGMPTTFTESFTVPRGIEAPFRIVVVNGNPDGTRRASSATVELNGSRIVLPNDFSQTVATIERQVSLEATNALTVEVSSNPEAFISVAILGQRVGPAEQVLERVAQTIGSNGGSVAMPGIVVALPEQAARAPLTLTLERFAIEAAPPPYAIAPDTGEIFSQGLKVTSTEIITSTVGITVTVPSIFLDRIPADRTVELFAEITQLGADDEVLKSYGRLGATFDRATGQARALIPATAFAPTNSVATKIIMGTYPDASPAKIGVGIYPDALATSDVTISNVQPTNRIEVAQGQSFSVSADLSFTLPNRIRNPLGAGTLSEAAVKDPFGPRRQHPVNGQPSFHRGVDLATNRLPVFASESGEVLYSGPEVECNAWVSQPPLRICKKGWGHVVMIAHDGGKGLTRYGHLWPESMARLGPVEKGHQIGISDTSGQVSGAHLHLEYLWEGLEVDPWFFLDAQNAEKYLSGLIVFLAINGQPVANSRVEVKALLDGTKGGFRYAPSLNLTNLGFALSPGEHLVDLNIETPARTMEGTRVTKKLADFTLVITDEDTPAPSEPLFEAVFLNTQPIAGSASAGGNCAEPSSRVASYPAHSAQSSFSTINSVSAAMPCASATATASGTFAYEVKSAGPNAGIRASADMAVTAAAPTVALPTRSSASAHSLMHISLRLHVLKRVRYRITSQFDMDPNCSTALGHNCNAHISLGIGFPTNTFVLNESRQGPGTMSPSSSGILEPGQYLFGAVLGASVGAGSNAAFDDASARFNFGFDLTPEP
jgi:murein DD-endopeptidase MepM/ murein hydrolase activator NlpD